MDQPLILVVEDDAILARAHHRLLTKIGYRVCDAATTGLAAIERVREQVPDLILMDISLKGNLDGIETAELIRTQFDVPVIYATAFTDQELLERAKRSEPFGYIVKPFGERELRSSIEMALYKHGAERRIRRSEERFRKLTGLAPFALSVARDDGTFTFLNAMFTQIFGYLPEEVPDLRTFVHLTCPEDLSFATEIGQWQEGPEAASATGGISVRELAVVCKNGDEKVVSTRTVSLEDGSRIIAYQDVTPEARQRENLELLVQERTRELVEQKTWLEREIDHRLMAEEALRSSEQRFRTIFESAGECIFIKDSAGKYVHVNPHMERLVGLSATALLGETDERVYGNDATHIRDVEARVLQGESVEEEHTRTVNGSRTTFHDIRTPLTDGQGNIIGVIGISRDVTERKGAGSRPCSASQPFVAKSTKQLQEKALLAAQRDCVVLLLGESGSGKDWFARYIHDHSARSGSPFFSVNCAAIPSELAESELFGHERGAYTGAGRRKRGLLELAEGGSLLLNEIGDMPLPLQSKLLTFLDTRSFTRLGGEDVVKVNARLLVATNRDLEAEVETGSFRRDLFYRLNVFSLTVPPLRERVEDMPLLVQEFLDMLANDMQIKDPIRIDGSALEALKRYPWPGNVRELRNVLERALILSEGNVVGIDCLQIDKKLMGDWRWSTSFPPAMSFNGVLAHLKRALVEEALARAGGKRIEAAHMLGMTRDALKKQMKTLGMFRDD
jgi:PAS domain S-box-containing protein